MEVKQNQLKKICDFYAITHKLKTILRSGWVQWNVKAERIESVAEHIYGTQMLAFAINAEFNLELNIERVVLMLAIHELGETIVGDITIADGVSKEEKHRREMEAVVKILEPLADSTKIQNLFCEFEDGITKESKFAHMVDKLECDFECKFYEENGYNDFLTPREGFLEKERQVKLQEGHTTLAKAWIAYDKKHCGYDDMFMCIADYLSENDVFVKNN